MKKDAFACGKQMYSCLWRKLYLIACGKNDALLSVERCSFVSGKSSQELQWKLACGEKYVLNYLWIERCTCTHACLKKDLFLPVKRKMYFCQWNERCIIQMYEPLLIFSGVIMMKKAMTSFAAIAISVSHVLADFRYPVSLCFQ